MAARKGRSTRTLENTASDVGRALGKVAAKVDALKRERSDVAAEIRGLINTAQRMLADLGDDAAIAGHKMRKAARSGRRRLSPEGRARIVAALRRRWDKFHADQKGSKKS